jgi:alkaline phosphatase D
VPTAREIFPLSVASGDPAPDGIVLWTRIAPSGDGAVPGRWEIGADPDLRDVVADGDVVAEPGRDWTVKVRVRSAALAPFTTYWYRFRARGASSAVGRFKTLPHPEAGIDRLRLGYVSCQDFTAGRFTALRKLAGADVDYVLHLGDYIYETVSDPQFQRRGPRHRQLRLPDGGARAETLEHYRWLYRTYRADGDLQFLHERFAVIAIWDDHEFANDGYGVHDTDTLDEDANADPTRRSAASQAWTEYVPADVTFDPDAPPLEQLRIYRSFVFGDLAELVLTDERLYRDGPPCGLGQAQRYATHGCAQQHAEGRTMMGVEQREWLVERLITSTRRWKLWANETMLMPFRLPGWLASRLHPHSGDVPLLDDVYVNLDQWDGYQWERSLLTDALADVTGLVALTGDLHSFVSGTLRASDGRDVATCLMVGSVTSANLLELLVRRTLPSLPLPLGLLVRSANPHLSYVNSSAHGYNVLELDRRRLRCTMTAVSGVRVRWAFTWPLRTIRVDLPSGHASVADPRHPPRRTASSVHGNPLLRRDAPTGSGRASESPSPSASDRLDASGDPGGSGAAQR